MNGFLIKCTIILLFTNGFINAIKAQKLTDKQETTIRKTIEAQYGDYNTIAKLNLGLANFCVVGKDTLYNPDGFHYVFKLSGDSAIRLDHSIWHGGNFRRFLFSDNDNLYALGGYGFFTTNNNLEYFNPKIKEWSCKPTFGKVPKFINGLCFRQGDFIYNINNYKSGNSVTPDVFDTCVYKLNLKTMVWDVYLKPDTMHRVYGTPIYFKDYCILLGEAQSLLVKPSEMNYILFTNENYGFLHSSQLYAINDNIFILKTIENPPKPIFDTVNLDEIWKKNIVNVKPLQLLPNVKPRESLSYTYWLLAFIILSSIPIMAYYYKKRKKSIAIVEEKVDSETTQKLEIDDIPTEELKSDLYKAILNCGKLHVSTEELDELLAISHLEPDSKKLKRHRLLNKIEKNHPGFIVRVKDQIDKRQFSYKITRV